MPPWGQRNLLGHTLGESHAEFVAIEHPVNATAPGSRYTGTIHCFDTKDLGDQCNGPRDDFGNAHFTFINDTLASMERLARGIIGHPKQNWNWNLYLAMLNKQYGKPDRMTARDAVWLKGKAVIHAYFTQGPMPFNASDEEQIEHIEVLSREAYDDAKK